MKRLFLIEIAFLLLVGCAKQANISQADYDKAIAENESLKAELQKSQETTAPDDSSNTSVEDKNTSILFHDEKTYGIYSGGWKDEKPDGEGVFIAKENWKYKGEFKNGTLEGNGVVSYDDGTSISGLFKEGWLNSGSIEQDGFVITVIDGEPDTKSFIMSLIKNIEKGQEKTFENETMANYSHRIDSVTPAYDFIEENFDEFINAKASSLFLAKNSQGIDLNSFYKDVTRYGDNSWNWEGWTITNIQTELIDFLPEEYKICTVTMQKGSANYLNGFIVGKDLDDIIDSINIGDVVSFNAVPIYSTVVSLDSDAWHDDGVVIARFLEETPSIEEDAATAAWSEEEYMVALDNTNARYADNPDRVYTQLSKGTIIGHVKPVSEFDGDFVLFTMDGVNLLIMKQYIEPVN